MQYVIKCVMLPFLTRLSFFKTLKCVLKTRFRSPGDDCIKHPKNCHKGLAFSIWEKATFTSKVLNIFASHQKRYILSSGGDYDYDSGETWPGFSLYHEGMDVVALVSTGQDVWELKVRGPIENDTWVNFGINWIAEEGNTDTEPGLELYMNSILAGKAILPLSRPGFDADSKKAGNWKEQPTLTVRDGDETWRSLERPLPPILMIGCHRNEADKLFGDFSLPAIRLDELAIWTRKLKINVTHNEILYFTAGYGKLQTFAKE